MSAVGTQAAESKHRINALGLASQMGIPLATLSHAAHAELTHLQTAPDAECWQAGLQPVAALWDDMKQTFGGEMYARAFLNQIRPELENQTPLHYLEAGEPGIVQDLVYAMKEMLP